MALVGMIELQVKRETPGLDGKDYQTVLFDEMPALDAWVRTFLPGKRFRLRGEKKWETDVEAFAGRLP